MEQLRRKVQELRERLNELGFLIQSCSPQEQRNYESEVRAVTAALLDYENLLRCRGQSIAPWESKS